MEEFKKIADEESSDDRDDLGFDDVDSDVTDDDIGRGQNQTPGDLATEDETERLINEEILRYSKKSESEAAALAEDLRQVELLKNSDLSLSFGGQ